MNNNFNGLINRHTNANLNDPRAYAGGMGNMHGMQMPNGMSNMGMPNMGMHPGMMQQFNQMPQGINMQQIPEMVLKLNQSHAALANALDQQNNRINNLENNLKLLANNNNGGVVMNQQQSNPSTSYRTFDSPSTNHVSTVDPSVFTELEEPEKENPFEVREIRADNVLTCMIDGPDNAPKFNMNSHIRAKLEKVVNKTSDRYLVTIVDTDSLSDIATTIGEDEKETKIPYDVLVTNLEIKLSRHTVGDGFFNPSFFPKGVNVHERLKDIFASVNNEKTLGFIRAVNKWITVSFNMFLNTCDCKLTINNWLEEYENFCEMFKTVTEESRYKMVIKSWEKYLYEEIILEQINSNKGNEVKNENYPVAVGKVLVLNKEAWLYGLDSPLITYHEPIGSFLPNSQLGGELAIIAAEHYNTPTIFQVLTSDNQLFMFGIGPTDKIVVKRIPLTFI